MTELRRGQDFAQFNCVTERNGNEGGRWVMIYRTSHAGIEIAQLSPTVKRPKFGNGP
jgi:hypothetical protein